MWTNSIATCTTSTLADVFVDSTGMGVGVWGVCGGVGWGGSLFSYQSHLHRFSCLFILVNSYTYIGSYNVPPCLFNMVITEFDVLTSLFVSIPGPVFQSLDHIYILPIFFPSCCCNFVFVFVVFLSVWLCVGGGGGGGSRL